MLDFVHVGSVLGLSHVRQKDAGVVAGLYGRGLALKLTR